MQVRVLPAMSLHIETYSSLTVSLERLANRDYTVKQPSQRDEKDPDSESVFQYTNGNVALWQCATFIRCQK